MSSVTLTVVTPTHGRPALVGQLLASLSIAVDAFAHEGGTAQVVLVDSSVGEDASAIAALAAGHGATLVRSHNDVRHKRNVGVALATGELVLFVDSDCKADPRLLVEHAAAHRVARAPDGRPVAGVLGLVRLTGARTPAWRAAEAAGFCDSFDFAARYPQADWGPCANLSFRREILVAVGGFREQWPRRLGGDDVELGMRINAGGHAILCRPEAVVEHSRATWARWAAVLERAWRWGAMDLHVRAALPASRRRPAGAGPELVLVAGVAAVVAQAVRARRLTALLRLAPVAGTALLCQWRPRRPLLDGLAGDALQLLFACGATAEAVRRGRPALAFAGLHPVDRGAAVRRARRRSATTAAGLLAVLSLARMDASR